MKIKEFIVESSLSRIYQHVKNHSVGAITAHRAGYSPETNAQRNRKLASYLSSRGYNITVIDGGYIENPGTPEEREVKEKTLFVVNPVEGDDDGRLERDLVSLGELYDQDSVLSYRHGDKPTYIGTTHRPDADPGYGERFALSSTEWGSPSGPYFSSVRGRKWAYNESVEYQHPTSVNGLTTRYLTAKSVQKELDSLGKTK
jgi:hypothetical protein